MYTPFDSAGFPSDMLAKARRRHLVRQSVLLQRPLCGPMEAGIIPTYRCNHGCSFCPLPLDRAGQGEMPPEFLLRIIDELTAADCEQISFTGGGEPLMYKALPEMVRRVRERGMACSVCTNGSLLTPQTVDEWARLGVHVAVSFNAARSDTYRMIHRGAKADDFERIPSMLRRFSEAARREGGEGSFVSMNFVVHRANYDQIEEMAELARVVGAAQIQFRHIQPRAEHRELLPTAEQLAIAREAVRKVETAAADNESFTVQIAQSLRDERDCCEPTGVLQPGVTPQSFLDDRTQAPCIEGYIATYIDADGSVFPCCIRSVNIGNHRMGDLREKSFREIWEGESYRAFRRVAFGLDWMKIEASENSCAHCPKAKHFLYLIDEFTPGNYLDLLRRRNEDLQRNCDGTVVRLDAFIKLPPSAMRMSVVADDLPATLDSGQAFVATVRVRNESDRTWPGADLARDFAVGLGYHLLDRRGHTIRFDNNPRAYLTTDLPPGGETELRLTLQAPSEAGQYRIELDMVQERVGWFAQSGGKTKSKALRVQP